MYTPGQSNATNSPYFNRACLTPTHSLVPRLQSMNRVSYKMILCYFTSRSEYTHRGRKRRRIYSFGVLSSSPSPHHHHHNLPLPPRSHFWHLICLLHTSSHSSPTRKHYQLLEVCVCVCILNLSQFHFCLPSIAFNMCQNLIKFTV